MRWSMRYAESPRFWNGWTRISVTARNESNAQFLAGHYLAIRLSEDSRLQVSRLARHEDVRADHVTLAYPRDGDELSSSWIPEPYQVGDRVSLKAVAVYLSDEVQVLKVELSGSSKRPFDDGTLHVTVSTRVGTSANESNDVLKGEQAESIDLSLSGTIEWIAKGD